MADTPKPRVSNTNWDEMREAGWRHETNVPRVFNLAGELDSASQQRIEEVQAANRMLFEQLVELYGEENVTTGHPIISKRRPYPVEHATGSTGVYVREQSQ